VRFLTSFRHSWGRGHPAQRIIPKVFKSQPQQFAFWELVFNWHKIFLADNFGRTEMIDSTMLSHGNRTSTAQSCAEDQKIFFIENI